MINDMLPEEVAALRAQLRARNPPKRELEGEERERMLTITALMAPIEGSDYLTTHCIVSQYKVDGKTIEVTEFFSDAGPLVEVYEP